MYLYFIHFPPTDYESKHRINRYRIEHRKFETLIETLGEKTRKRVEETINKLSLLYDIPEYPFYVIATGISSKAIIARCRVNNSASGIYLYVEDETGSVNILTDAKKD